MAEKRQQTNMKSKNLIEEDLSKAKIVRKRSNPLKRDTTAIATMPMPKRKSSPKRGTTSKKTAPPETTEDQEIPSKFPKQKPGKEMPVVDGMKLSVKVDLEVMLKSVKLQQPKKPVRTPSQVIDEHNQIFEYGSATVTILSERGLPEERVIPLDAEDIELISKLLGAAES